MVNFIKQFQRNLDEVVVSGLVILIEQQYVQLLEALASLYMTFIISLGSNKIQILSNLILRI